MALVNVVNMVVLDNPTCFLNPFQFEITFECLQELEDDLEWKVLYVGSAHDAHKDQVLDEILVGPVPVGINKFVLQADAPRMDQLPPDDILGVTVVLVTCSYKDREFVRVGYYVNNEYVHPAYQERVQEALQKQKEQQQQGDVGDATLPAVPIPEPPATLSACDLEFVQRQILADKPRVTKFPISWGNNNNNNDTVAVGSSRQQDHVGDAEEEHEDGDGQAAETNDNTNVDTSMLLPDDEEEEEDIDDDDEVSEDGNMMVDPSADDNNGDAKYTITKQRQPPDAAATPEMAAE